MDITKELPTVIAFCAGYGGIERGLDLAGFEHRVIAYVEIEAFAIANLVNKMEAGQLPPAPIYTNLKTFPAHLFRDRVDLITGGYPCQPFSAAGKRLGEDDPRHLWPFIRRHIEAIRPARCFFENVEGHISLGLSTVISDLEEDGYRATWGIFSAREVGAPHQRKRVYILGNSEHYGSSTSEIRGGASSTSNNTTQGQNEAIKSQRASQPDCGGDLSGANELADSNSIGLEEHGHCEPSNVVKASETVADTDSNQQRPWVRQEQSQRYTAGQCSSDSGTVGIEGVVADSNSTLSKRGRIPSRVDKGHTNINGRGNESRGFTAQQWSPEPCVGRVVNGCADRVDRLRLLGNGVVPQTAAKAWGILSKRLN